MSLLGLGITQSARANLITNPGFETGDFAGWTAVGPNLFVHGTFGGIAPHSGNFQAIFDHATTSITQNLATIAGTSYVLDFWVAINMPLPDNSFAVQWGGSTIFSLTATQGPFGYTEHTFNVTASSATTALQFQDSNFGPAGSFLLDDVSVTPAGVPDGGSTVSLLGCALLGLVVLRRKLSC